MYVCTYVFVEYYMDDFEISSNWLTTCIIILLAKSVDYSFNVIHSSGFKLVFEFIGYSVY